MQIIPVIDLKQGQVVHARMGDRDRYAPVRSRLCDGSDPVAVVSGLMELYPFATLYVADLDAIGGAAGHDRALGDIAARFPSLRLWVDRGVRSAADGRAWLALGRGELVLGSESVDDETVAWDLVADAPDRVVLSLDFRGDEFQGPAGVLERPERWPPRVIAMTLARVGSGAGPDLDRLARIGRRAGPQRRVYAAGGVRNEKDLHALASARVAGALVATALHDGRLGRRAIAAACGSKAG